MTVQVTAAHLRAAAKGAVTAQNMMSVLVAVDRYGKELGMDRTHRSVQFYAQIMHESGDFRYDREIWGPTDAQKRYDARVDLGNTPAADGDGKLYMGSIDDVLKIGLGAVVGGLLVFIVYSTLNTVWWLP